MASSRRSATAQASAASGTGDDVQADAVAEVPPGGFRPPADVVDLLPGGGGRLAPHEPHVGVLGGHLLAGVGGAPEEDAGHRVEPPVMVAPATW